MEDGTRLSDRLQLPVEVRARTGELLIVITEEKATRQRSASKMHSMRRY
jgi:hypothetical protein